MGSQYIEVQQIKKQTGIRNKSYIKYLTNKKQKTNGISK